jgi:hypothetical protein
MSRKGKTKEDEEETLSLLDSRLDLSYVDDDVEEEDGTSSSTSSASTKHGSRGSIYSSSSSSNPLQPLSDEELKRQKRKSMPLKRSSTGRSLPIYTPRGHSASDADSFSFLYVGSIDEERLKERIDRGAMDRATGLETEEEEEAEEEEEDFPDEMEDIEVSGNSVADESPSFPKKRCMCTSFCLLSIFLSSSLVL